MFIMKSLTARTMNVVLLMIIFFICKPFFIIISDDDGVFKSINSIINSKIIINICVIIVPFTCLYVNYFNLLFVVKFLEFVKPFCAVIPEVSKPERKVCLFFLASKYIIAALLVSFNLWVYLCVRF